VVHRAEPSGRASAIRMAIWRSDLEFGAVPQPDLVGSGGGGISGRLGVLGAGWMASRGDQQCGMVVVISSPSLPPVISPGWGPWRAGGLLDGAATRPSGGSVDHRWSRTSMPSGSPAGGGVTWWAAAVIVW
jgi:hypothetical protein